MAIAYLNMKLLWVVIMRTYMHALLCNVSFHKACRRWIPRDRVKPSKYECGGDKSVFFAVLLSSLVMVIISNRQTLLCVLVLDDGVYDVCEGQRPEPRTSSLAAQIIGITNQ